MPRAKRLNGNFPASNSMERCRGALLRRTLLNPTPRQRAPRALESSPNCRVDSATADPESGESPGRLQPAMPCIRSRARQGQRPSAADRLPHSQLRVFPVSLYEVVRAPTKQPWVVPVISPMMANVSLAGRGLAQILELVLIRINAQTVTHGSAMISPLSSSLKSHCAASRC